MNKFRKILQCALSILMAFVLVFAIGCEGCAQGSGDGNGAIIRPPQEQTAVTFELNQSQIECIVGDVDKLSPKSLPNIGEATLTWRSEDSKIVTVDNNGNFEAISAGTAKIIATYGTASASCTIIVSWDDESPQIISPANDEGKFSIVVGQEYKFTPSIQYRGKIYNDGELTVEVSDSAVTALDVATATITGATKGTSNVTISGTWRGKEAIRASFNVTVSDDITLYATDAGDNIYPTDQIDLYTSAKSFRNLSDQPSSVSFIPTAQIKEDVNSEPRIVDMTTNPNDFSVVVADNRASFNKSGKTLMAVSYGDTIATMKFNYDGQTFVKQFYVHLERPIATLNKEINYFSAIKGTLRDENSSYAEKTIKEFIYGSKTDVIRTASFNGQDLIVDESTGAIFGVTGPSNGVYTAVIRVGTDVEQYDVTTKVYGQFVYEATDLDVFVRTAASPDLDVYVELARDIDLANYVKPAHFNDIDTSSTSTDPNKDIIPNHKWQTNKFVAKGFMGTFDGNGHYLMNYVQQGGHGFFEALTGATIKNVGFVNCSTQDSSFFATAVSDVKMENVYIKMAQMKSSTSYWPVGVISNYDSLGGSYKNVFIDLEETNLENVLEAGRDRYYWNVYSAFVTFPLITQAQPKFENCLVISKAPLSSMGYVEHTGSQGPRFFVADNVPEAERVDLRQRAWNAQSETQKQQVKGAYTSKYNSDKINFPNPESAEFTADPSLYLEYFYNDYRPAGTTDTRRTSLVKAVEGVRSYKNVADMLSDSTSLDYISNFSSEFWTVNEGQLTWGKHPANIKDGDILLEVGDEVRGKLVEGISLNPLTGNKAGQTVQIGALSCFGYIFDGWKNGTTGEELAKVGDKWSFTYSGKATILVAKWKLDPNVQVNSGIK